MQDFRAVEPVVVAGGEDQRRRQLLEELKAPTQPFIGARVIAVLRVAHMNHPLLIPAAIDVLHQALKRREGFFTVGAVAHEGEAVALLRCRRRGAAGRHQRQAQRSGQSSKTWYGLHRRLPAATGPECLAAPAGPASGAS